MYLYLTAWNRYGPGQFDAKHWLSQLPIAHIYGSLGELPGIQVPDDAATMVAYGHDFPSDDVIRRSAAQVRIMTERAGNNVQIGAAHTILSNAERIVFLGFGYDETNLTRLLSYGPGDRQQFVGSALGLSDAEREIAKARIVRAGASPDSVVLDNDERDGDCLRFLRKYCWLG